MTSGVVGGVGGSRKIACMRVWTEDLGILHFDFYDFTSYITGPCTSLTSTQRFLAIGMTNVHYFTQIQLLQARTHLYRQVRVENCEIVPETIEFCRG